MKKCSKFSALILVFLLALVLPTVVFADDEDLTGQTGPKDKNATVELVDPDALEDEEDAELEEDEEDGPPVRIQEKQDEQAELKAERLELRLTVKGQEMKLDVPPVIKEGRVLIPLRAMAAITGADVRYDEAHKIVTLEFEDKTIHIEIDNDKVIIDDGDVETEMTLDVPAQIEDGRTIVPLRFIAETLGLRVNYDAGSKSIDVGENENDEDENDEDEDVDDEDDADDEDEDADDDDDDDDDVDDEENDDDEEELLEEQD